MKIRRGSAIAIASAVIGLGTMAIAGFIFRDQLLEEWRLARSRMVSGKVRFNGNPPPAPAPIVMDCDPNCAALNRAPVFPEDVVLNRDRTLMNVLVHVNSGLEGKTFPVPPEPVVLDQVGCRFAPHVFGIQVQQPLEILNSDATNHNVHALAKKGRSFNLGMPTKGMKVRQKFYRPENSPPVRIKCEVHPWMTAWCGVFDHPYFAVTDGKGQFRIPNLPPGRYTLTAWHEKYGELQQAIEVPYWGSRRVDFAYQGK
jgi:hypothetical protein